MNLIYFLIYLAAAGLCIPLIWVVVAIREFFDMRRIWSVSVQFAWYDLWVGCYVDRKNRTIYVCPLPMVVVRVHWYHIWAGGV